MSSTLPPRESTGSGRSRLLARCLLPVLIAAFAAPVLAPIAARADTPVPETTDARLRRIEGELRALQRRVFPDGAGRTFAAQITPNDATAPSAPEPAGNAGALADLLSRMDAVEGQLKALTATSEDNQNRMAKLETRIGAVETAQATAAPMAAPVAPPVVVADTPPAPAKPTKGKPAPKSPDPAASPSSPEAADHSAAVAAIERPSSDDKAEDAYTYGYRLWEAKFLPEAEAVLNDFVQQYPRHKRISYARNLLGRTYLDDNKPGAAAQWFVQNYQADKAGDRASDSLLYLAVAMARLKETKRACVALGEFRDTYPADAAGRLKGQFDAVTKTVACH
jgi:TolA-binding protein